MASMATESKRKARSVVAVEAVQDLRKNGDNYARRQAMRAFAKNLRKRDGFHPSWEAVGGAQGLANLMAEFSVQHVRMLCRFLGRTGPAAYLRVERRAALTQLVQILASGETDARPLRNFYQAIVPACEPEFVKTWELQTAWTGPQKRQMWLADRQQYEELFLERLFSESSRTDPNTFQQNARLFRGNLPFCEVILRRLASTTSEQFHLPSDFVVCFLIPLLKKLSNKHRKSLRDEKNKFLGLINECFIAYPQLSESYLDLKNPRGLLLLILKQIISTPRDRDLLIMHLKALLVLAQTKDVWIGDICAIPYLRNCTPQLRFDLICMLLIHCKEYAVDVKNISLVAEQRIVTATQKGKLWPAQFFLSIPSQEALALFGHLRRLHQGRSFISPALVANSVLCQLHNPDAKEVDLEIFQTVLEQKKAPRSEVWAARGVYPMIAVRKKAASESREPRHRAFWAKSALRLCIATGDFELLQDTIVWARRFLKDPFVGPDIFGPSVINSPELKALLVAIPLRAELDKSERVAEGSSTAEREILPSNDILITLLQTALSAMFETPFKQNDGNSIITLARIVAEGRVTGSTQIFRLSSGAQRRDLELRVAASIWKPTIDGLLDIEALLSDPAASKIFSHGRASMFTASNFMSRIGVSDPSILADLTTYYFEGMNSRLAPALVKTYMTSVVDAVVRLAHSNRPELAIPFIRPIIRNSEDSYNHRRLFTNPFLESLPASTAREFVVTTSSAILDLMRQQNTRPWKEGEAPAVKVTTIKMVAQVLEGNRVLSPQDSCDITVSLLKEARHIDARVAIINSLLSVLIESTSTAELRKYILDVFEEYVLPVASRLNERYPTTEEHWQQAEMPEVSEQNSVLNCLGSKPRHGLKPDDRERLVRLLMSALEHSAVENTRWLNLFAQRCVSGIAVENEIHAGPVSMDLLVKTFYADFDLIPSSLLDTLQDMILNNVDPSSEILKITATVKADATLAESNAGRHWLSQMDSPGTKAFSLGISEAVKLLRNKLSFKDGDASIQRLQQLIISAARRYIRLGDVDAISQLVASMTTKIFSADRGEPGWQGRCMPIIEEVIRIVEEESRAGRTDILLPNVFRMRLAMLHVPLWQHSPPLPESVAASFTEKLSLLVDQLVARRRPYHLDFAFLKSEIERSVNHFPGNAQVGLALARGEDDWQQQEPSLATYLRWELVATYLKSARAPKDKRLEDEVRQLLQEWTACPVGEVRVMGLEVETALKKNGWQMSQAQAE